MHWSHKKRYYFHTWGKCSDTGALVSSKLGIDTARRVEKINHNQLNSITCVPKKSSGLTKNLYLRKYTQISSPDDTSELLNWAQASQWPSSEAQAAKPGPRSRSGGVENYFTVAVAILCLKVFSLWLLQDPEFALKTFMLTVS